MKRTFFALFLLLFISCGNSKQDSSFKTILVSAKVKDFPNVMDLSSPLKSNITVNYALANGRYSLLPSISSLKFKYHLADSKDVETEVEESKKAYFLNTEIVEYITYKDSVACVISHLPDSRYSIRQFYLENNNWVNAGEDRKNSLKEARDYFMSKAEQFLKMLTQLTKISEMPSDTSSFVSYIKDNGMCPELFLLQKLMKHKVVLFGEIHRRKVSWDFIDSTIHQSQFPEFVGVVFMEMAANKQADIDLFYSKKHIDKELLLNVFRDYIIAGWNDKGKFDFLISIWMLNQKLPKEKRIKVIAVDTPRVFTEEGILSENHARDDFMAATILNYLKSSNDLRNSLFIVGSGHVCKSNPTVGQILSERMTDSVYSIFTHCPRIDNFIDIPERIRGGMFDYAFYKNGDKPVAFELINSPYGREPFDGLYLNGFGTYQDNFDGYIFLGSLDNEPNGEDLLEMYTDDFISEIDRRYKLYNDDFLESWGLKELSAKAVVEFLKSNHTNKRWENIIIPLKR